MAHLIVLCSNGESQEILMTGKRLILGRDADYSDGVIPDPAVSRIHLMILQMPEGFVLKDMDSTGGTFLNKKKILRHPLKNGDSIQIGSSVLEFRTDDAEDDVPEQEGRNEISTISGIAQTFRRLPAGMTVNCRILHVAPPAVFNPGDTVHIANGGVRLPNFLGCPANNMILELELIWPDGKKKSFLGEMVQVFAKFLCVKLHVIPPADYQRMMDKTKREGWITLQ